MNRRNAWFAAALLSVTPVPSDAIVMRHDRPDEAYRALAAGSEAVGTLSGSAGTLVAPRWVLTAGHVAAGISPFTREIQFGDLRYSVIGIVHHPSWSGASSETSLDMALLKLDRPVSGIRPAALYAGDAEVGMEVRFVGEGQSGDGRTGPRDDDRVRRGATNTVQGLMGDYLIFRFDAPPGGTDLEGISGPGDSGGPALIFEDGGPAIIGVSSGNDGQPVCRYGTREAYARVSIAREWIERTIREDLAPALAWREPQDISKAGWPDTPLRPAAALLFKAFASGRQSDFEQLERAGRSDDAARRRSLDVRVSGFMKIREQMGRLEPYRAVVDGADLVVLAEAERKREDGRTWWSVRFVGAGARYETVQFEPLADRPR